MTHTTNKITTYFSQLKYLVSTHVACVNTYGTGLYLKLDNMLSAMREMREQTRKGNLL